MNYLGHAYLSFGIGEILAGNMIADEVKGKLAQSRYPERIWQGIMLHRAIDEFTDRHDAVRRGKILFRPAYGLYAGALIDVFLDHFLANDPRMFNDKNDLLQFSGETYRLLDAFAPYFPPRFASYYPSMVQHNWLAGYRGIPTMARALNGLARRAPLMPAPAQAYDLFIAHYYELNQCYFEFIDDIIGFVKIELSKVTMSPV